MGAFTIFVSSFTNSPKRAFLIPCYHCQARDFQIPIQYRPLHTLVLTPASPLLPLHFKLEDLHFEFHTAPPASASLSELKYASNQQLNQLETFARSLAQTWVNNLEILSSFLPHKDSPDIEIVTRQSFGSEILILNWNE